MNKIPVLTYKEASSIDTAPSITEFVTEWDSGEKEAVLLYLNNNAFKWMASAGMPKVDAFTGKPIPGLYDDYSLDESGYCWCADLPYYIEKYNVGVPREFINMVLSLAQ